MFQKLKSQKCLHHNRVVHIFITNVKRCKGERVKTVGPISRGPPRYFWPFGVLSAINFHLCRSLDWLFVQMQVRVPFTLSIRAYSMTSITEELTILGNTLTCQRLAVKLNMFVQEIWCCRYRGCSAYLKSGLISQIFLRLIDFYIWSTLEFWGLLGRATWLRVLSFWTRQTNIF